MILSVYLKSYFSDCYVHLTLVLIHFVKRRLLMEWQSPCSLMKFSPRAVESSHPISSQLVVVLLFLRLRLFLKNAYTQRILQNTNSKNHRSKSKSKQIEEFHEYKKSTPLTDIGEGWADVNTWCLSLRETNTNIMITFQWKRGRENFNTKHHCQESEVEMDLRVDILLFFLSVSTPQQKNDSISF